jgi:hypothetical protein
MAAALAILTLVPRAHAASIVVTTTANSGPGSLRQALLDANGDGALDSISFAIAAADVPRIALTSALPTVTGPVTIDGTTQAPAGWVEIDGQATAAATGLTLAGGGSTVRGLVIDGFGHAGIMLTGAGNNVVEGCRLGTDPTGSLARSGLAYGVEVSSSPANRIGGTSPGSGNLLSGNLFGIFVHGSAAIGTLIQANLIGTDASGTLAVPNGATGVWIFGAPQTVVGGTDPAAGNVIAGNGTDGIDIAGAGATDTIVQGNAIGFASDLVTPIGNAQDGVYVSAGAGRITVGGAAGNSIGNNGGAGVRLDTTAGTRTTVRANVITSNGSLGIDLGMAGVTANDAGDADGGPNGQQNFPVLVSIAPDGTSVSGTLDSASNASFTVEVFAESACDPSGNGEGDELLAAQIVTTDGVGHAEFTVPLSRVVDASSEHLSATATDSSGNTSEFSACLPPAAPSTTSTTSTTTTSTSSTTTSSPASSTTTTTAAAPTTTTSTAAPATTTSTMAAPSTTTTTSAAVSTTTTTAAPVTTTSTTAAPSTTTTTSDPAATTTSTTAPVTTTSTTAPPSTTTTTNAAASTTTTTAAAVTTTSTTAAPSTTTTTSDPAATTTSTTAAVTTTSTTASPSTTTTTNVGASTTTTTTAPVTTTSTTAPPSTTTTTSDPAATTTTTTASPSTTTTSNAVATTTTTTAAPVTTTSTAAAPSTTATTTSDPGATTTSPTTTSTTAAPTTTTLLGSTTSTTHAPASSTTSTVPAVTTTSSPHSSSTTTTLPGCADGVCEPGDCVVEATFDSLRCRLDLLGNTVAGSPDLGEMRERLGGHLLHAETLLGRSDDRCAAAKRGPARRSLRQVGRHLVRVRRMLATKTAHKASAEVVEALSASAVQLRGDALTLGRSLVCP